MVYSPLQKEEKLRQLSVTGLLPEKKISDQNFLRLNNFILKYVCIFELKIIFNYSFHAIFGCGLAFIEAFD